jgi:hypothetical protein
MPDVPTLVLYLEETPKESHDPDNLFGSLVKQLIQLRDPADPVPNKIRHAWEKASKIDVRPNPEALEESFRVSHPIFAVVPVCVNEILNIRY